MNILIKSWTRNKLQINTNKPMPHERAAHISAVDDNALMMIYGGI